MVTLWLCWVKQDIVLELLSPVSFCFLIVVWLFEHLKLCTWVAITFLLDRGCRCVPLSLHPILPPHRPHPHLPASSWAHPPRAISCAPAWGRGGDADGQRRQELPDEGREGRECDALTCTVVWLARWSGSEWVTQKIMGFPHLVCGGLEDSLSAHLYVFCAQKSLISSSALRCFAQSPIYDPTLECSPSQDKGKRWGGEKAQLSTQRWLR